MIKIIKKTIMKSKEARFIVEAVGHLFQVDSELGIVKQYRIFHALHADVR